MALRGRVGLRWAELCIRIQVRFRQEMDDLRSSRPCSWMLLRVQFIGDRVQPAARGARGKTSAAISSVAPMPHRGPATRFLRRVKQALSVASRWCLFSLTAVSAIWWMLAGSSNSTYRPTTQNEPAGVTVQIDSKFAHSQRTEEPSVVESTEVSLDFSSANKSSLLLKTISRKSSAESEGELWFRDAVGVEWRVARNVVQACFSPDGSRIAYSTVDDQLFVETVSGERLTNIQNAREPVWRSDGTELNFSAVLSNEYPDITQSASYNLNSGKITLPARDTTTSFPTLK
jgi:hypothetical protein